MNISLLITRSIAFTVIASVLALVGQERSIAASEVEIDSLIRKFSSTVENTYARSYRDSRKTDVKKAINTFQTAWAKSNPSIAPFLGNWSAIEEMKRIYPSQINGKVCIIDTFLARNGLGYEFSTGDIKNDRIYTSDNTVLFLAKSSQGKILGTVFTRKDNGQLGSYGYANPRPLISPSQAPSDASYSDNISPLSSQFESSGCMAGVPSSSRSGTQLADGRSPRIDGQTGAVNLGGSSYFSWGLLKSGSRDNDQPQIIMGYACQTQNQLQGISKRAFVTRYVIKRGRGTDDWWLESLGGGGVKPTDSGYVSEKVSGLSGKELKPYVTDASSGWLKRDMDVDGLGSACINGDVQSALSYIQRSVSGEPIATKPIEQLQPIAAKSNYAYPTAEEFEAFRKTVKSNNTISGADRSTWEQYHQTWQSKNDTIAPYLGAWKTADNTLLYVYPSPQKGRFCVVTKENGKLSTGKGLGYRREARYNGDFGLFKIEGLADVVAMRSDGGQTLLPLYAAIDEPELSADLREELETLKCVVELPKGVTSMKPLGIRKPYSGNRVRKSPSR